jgi:citrate lyase subunit beta/citryl-CoA lyase
MFIGVTLFVPGSAARRMVDAGLLGVDAIIFDLEDAVAQNQKDASRCLVRRFVHSGLCDYKWGVRVNGMSTPYFMDDLREIIPLKPELITFPMADSADQIRRLDDALSELEQQHRLEIGRTKVNVAIETPKGLMHTYEILTASNRIISVGLGSEDYAVALGTKRTRSNQEMDYARRRLVTEASAAGVPARDIPFTDVNDMEGLRAETEFAKTLGYSSKVCISPGQAKVIREVFQPTEAEIEHARRVIAAMKEAEEKGIGAVELDGKMLDVPVLLQAQNVLKWADSIKS